MRPLLSFVCFTIMNLTDVCYVGYVKVYNFRETVPQMFKPDLLNDCPASFSFSIGRQRIFFIFNENHFCSLIHCIHLYYLQPFTLQVASGLVSLESCVAMRCCTNSMGSCPGPSCLSQQLNWPERESLCPPFWENF